MKINRLIYNDLVSQIEEPKISILVGPRQVGKTFLLHELEDEAKRRGLKTRFFDLEQPGDMISLGATDKEQFDAIASAGQVVFVDEMHLLKNISHIFKAIYDKKLKVKIFASGSSALEMHKHLKESMAGRIIMNRIFPLCVSELKQIESYNEEDSMVYGGLPGLVNCAGKEAMIRELNSIVSTYIAKDIKSLIKEENIRAFNHLIHLLAQYQGSVVASSNLSREIGLSKPTVEKYLKILLQTYVCHSLNSYSKNMSNELKKSKKYYLFDPGIRNMLLKDFSLVSSREDAGVLKESFVLLNIIRQLKPNMEVRFWRTKRGDEIDFILLKNRVPLPVEVKSALREPSIPGGIRIFLDNYANAAGAIVFNDDIVEDVQYAGKTVSFQNLFSSDRIGYLQQIS